MIDLKRFYKYSALVILVAWLITSLLVNGIKSDIIEMQEAHIAIQSSDIEILNQRSDKWFDKYDSVRYELFKMKINQLQYIQK